MGTLSVNKLAGLSLILGPILALICYVFSPGGLLNDPVAPLDAAGTIGALQANQGLAHTMLFLLALGLVLLMYGIWVLGGNIKASGNGGALASMGGLLVVLATTLWLATTGLGHALAGSAGTNAAVGGVVFAVSNGINLSATLAAGLGLLLVALAVSTRDDSNKIAAYVAALAALVLLITTIIGGSDSSQAELMNQIGGLCLLVVTLWSVLLGVSLQAKE